MKQTKHFLRPLLMAIVMMVGMLVPQGAWAEELLVGNGQTMTISLNTNYEFITVLSGGTLIINEGVSVSATANGYIVADGTVINYGTINGIAVYNGATFANHGYVSENIFANGGTIYNTGTYVNKPWNNIDNQITPCEHAVCTEAEVAATCTHAGGMQTKCDVCHYIKSFVEDENSPALGHSFNSHKGINTCTRCGLATYDAPELKSGYYQIANAGNLYWFADKVNNDYANFKYANAKLTADIVVNEGTIDEDSNAIAWPGIGNLLRDTNDPEEGPQEGPHEEGDDRIKGYEGIFDGQGHTISGLYSRNGAAGLVEVSAGNCIIKNVGIVNSYFLNGTIGVICTVCADNTEISNCYSNAICEGDYIGGIVGILLSNQASIKNCYSTSTLSSFNSYEDRTGGIVGQISIDDGSIPSGDDESTALGANISNCYTTYKQICSNATGTNCEASVSADRFASGEIAWLLNDGKTDGTQAWYQKLGENGDSYPVLAAAEGNTVYYGYENCLSESETYSNDLRYAEKEDAHNYQVQKDENEKPVFVWSEDYTSATLQLVCSHDAEHTAGVEVTGEDITSEDTTPATCTTAGVRTYTAKATYEGETYTDTKVVEIPAGHSFVDGVCGVCHATAVAEVKIGETTTGYTDIQEAFDAAMAATGEVTVKLLADVTLTEGENNLARDYDNDSKDDVILTLDLNGHNVTGNYSQADIHVTSITLKITDSREGMTGSINNCRLLVFKSDIYVDEGVTLRAEQWDWDLVNLEKDCSLVNYGNLYGIVVYCSETEFYNYGSVVSAQNSGGYFENRGSFIPIWDWFYNDVVEVMSSVSVSVNGTNYYSVEGSFEVSSEVTKAPTCTEKGERTYSATVTYENKDYNDTYTAEIGIDPDAHSFTSKTLTAEKDANGLYAYVCDREGCGGHSDYNVVKASEGESTTTIELTANTDGGTTTYTASAPVSVPDGAFSTPVDFTATGGQVSIDRTFTTGTPATINLPFDVDASAMSETYYTFGGIEQNSETGKWVATMTPATDKLKANTPYIVLPSGTSISITDNTASVSFKADASANSTTTSGDWTMMAAKTAKTWAADDPERGKIYGFAGENKTVNGVDISAGQFVKAAAGASIKAGRAYLQYKDDSDPTTRAGVPELPATIEVRFVYGSATGIGTIDTESGAFTFDGWYDLNGNRVSEPVKGGVYINNNKKIMVK